MSASTTPDDVRVVEDLEKAPRGQVATAMSGGDSGGSILTRLKLATTGLGRTVSRTSPTTTTTPTTGKDLGPPPDGGWYAWIQVGLVHLTIINTWGFLNSFGFFQAYYVETLRRSPSDVSWVGSFQLWLLFAVGVLAGRATDAGHFRACYALGTVFLVLGLFMISLCSEYWQFFLSQGICQGIGNGLLFIPSLTIVPGYFLKNRVFAMATVSCGTATGGMLYSGLIQTLLPKIGFQWTIRTIGFIVLLFQLLSLCFLRHRIPARKSGPLIEWQAFKEPTYTLSAVAFFLVNMGIWFAYGYIPSFAFSRLHASQEDSTHLLLILNGPGIPGRLIPALIADRYTGPVSIMIVFSLITGITTFAWATVSSYNGLICWCVVYGFFAAGFLGLFPATIACLTKDPKKLGIRIGMVFTLVGFANLIGPPVSGALIQRLDGRYLGAQIFAGLCCCFGTFFMLVARVKSVGWSLTSRL